MALINNKIIVEFDPDIKKLLLEIKELLTEDPSGKIKKQIFDKLVKAIKDIKKTV